MFIALDGSRAIVLWWTLPTYMTLVGAALLVSAGVVLWRTRGTWRRDRAADSVLLAVAFGLIVARAVHVLLNWAYFREVPDEMLTFAAGGLDAHGAIIGAAAGGYLASRLFCAPFSTWLGAAAIALPVIACAAWWGCAAADCAYGAEVANLADYPRWLVWEARGDFLMIAPRYAVQPLAMVASAAVLVAILAAAWTGVGGWRLAGLALFGVMLVCVAVGGLRGDPSSYAQQPVMCVLDIGCAAAGLTIALWPRRAGVPSTEGAHMPPVG